MELAIRLEHESQFHESAWFVTLTYNDENLPDNGSTEIESVSKFVRALRKKIKQKMRYFGVSEYGGKMGRAHYHLILFGPDFPDRIIQYTTPNRATHSDAFIQMFGKGGARYYKSELLESIWNKGFVQLTSVSQATMQYVAKFHIDKVNGEKAANYYICEDDNGHYHDIEPEQSRMSNRPGIGHKWIEKYWSTVYPRGYLLGVGGVKFAPPKYYDRWLEKNHPKIHEQVKAKRQESTTVESLLVQKREAIMKIRAAQLGIGASIGPGSFKSKTGATAADLTAQFGKNR